MPQTTALGFEYEDPDEDFPGRTLNGGPDGTSPILAKQVQDALLSWFPGQRRIATAEITSNSSDFTGVEAEVANITADLVAGMVYRVTFSGAFSGDNTNDRVFARLREDNVSGTELAHQNLIISTTNANGVPLTFEREFTAASSESKTFSLTGDIVGGSGPARLRGLSTQPTYLYVDLIR